MFYSFHWKLKKVVICLVLFIILFLFGNASYLLHFKGNTFDIKIKICLYFDPSMMIII